MTDDTFTPAEQASWDAMKAEQPLPEPAATPEPTPAPTPEPAAAVPEPGPRPDPERPGDDKTFIPLARYLEDKHDLKRQLADVTRRLQEATSPRQPEQPKIDPRQQPHEAIELALNRLDRLDQQSQEQAELGAIADFGMRHAAEFKKTSPDFDDAYNHLRVSRAQQLVDAGVNPQEVGAYLRNEEADILRMCARMNVNPATFVYGLAQSAGYAKASPTPTPAVPTPETPRDPGTGQFVKTDPKTKVEIAAKGHDLAANPVAAAGAGQGGPLDLRALANLDGDEFDKATEGTKWRRLMGG